MNGLSIQLLELASPLVFLGAAGYYAFLWIHMSSTALRERIVFVLLGTCWTVVGTLAGAAALHVLERGEDALGDALLFLFLVLLGVPLIALGISSIIGSVLPNRAARRWVMIPLLTLTPVSGLLILVAFVLAHWSEIE